MIAILSTSRLLTGPAALAVVFFAAHLVYLPPTLEDVDSINFALAVRDFDVAQHQPHPPGYPVFVALARLSTAAAEALGVPHAAPRGLAFLSALSGSLLVPLIFTLFVRMTGSPGIAWWGMALAVCSPLFWFTALRPLSDTTGLLFAVSAQLLLLHALSASSAGLDRRPAVRALISGALVAGIAAGVRAQTVMLTGPLLAAVLLWRGTGLRIAERAAAVLAMGAGALLWFLPLLAASGGAGGYLEALGGQAGEDFSGVVMLWTVRSARVAADAVLYSFVWPWGGLWLGGAMLLAAAAGAVRLAWHLPQALVLLAIAFGPYAVFHLLFHETVTIRYALPLILPVALLAAYAGAALGRTALAVGSAAAVALMLFVTVPATQAYGRDGSPAFRALRAAESVPGREGAVLGMHAEMRRVAEWERPGGHAGVLRAPHGKEWLALVEHWRRFPDAPAVFLANPRRTDLALIDPQARTVLRTSRWTLPEMPFVGGTRPGATDVVGIAPPGWMLDRGWAVSAEVGGVTAREGLGPHIEPAVAWVRARPEGALLTIGGRNLGPAGAPPARITVAGPEGTIGSWDVPPGFFYRRIVLPAGTLEGSGYVPLRIGAVPAAGAAPVPVSLEQFDLQSDSRAMVGFVDGWGEPEYNPSTARAWRWMSEDARLWVRPIGRNVQLMLTGESPLRYFDRAPTVRVSIAGEEVARIQPSSDFEERLELPAALLEQADGEVRLQSDLWFSPAERSGAAVRRQLALRIYSVAVE